MTELFIPRSVPEAVEIAAEHGDDLIVMGGGTVVMSLINDGAIFPKRVMSLARAGMSGVHANGKFSIGATTPIKTLIGITDLPLLATAGSKIGGPQVRNVGTIGGNLFLPPPYGDLAPALLAYDADIVFVGKNGERSVPIEQFYATDNNPDELLLRVDVPRLPGSTAFMKYGRRAANTPSIVAVAVRVAFSDAGEVADARIALGAAASAPMRAHNAEAALTGQPLNADTIAHAAEAAMNECDPFTDALATGWYRRKMVRVFVKRALESIAG